MLQMVPSYGHLLPAELKPFVAQDDNRILLVSVRAEVVRSELPGLAGNTCPQSLSGFLNLVYFATGP